jgi:uncharacterized protein (TIRG00374 family)
VRTVAGALLLAAMLWIVGPARLAQALGRVDPPVFVLALVLGIASNVVSAARWAAIARAFGLVAPTPKLVPMYARGITSNTLLPGATLSGDTLRSIELSRLGNPMVESAASVAFDRFSGLWTLCVLSFAAVAVAVVVDIPLDLGAGSGTILATYGALLAAIVVGPFIPWPIHRLRHLNVKAAQKIADLWVRLHDPATGLKRRLWQSLWLSLLVQVLSALALAACGASLGADVPLVLMLAASAPIFVMAAVPLGVAGFGTRELAAVAVLGLAGVPADVAAGTGLLYGMLGVIQGVLAAPSFVKTR